MNNENSSNSYANTNILHDRIFIKHGSILSLFIRLAIFATRRCIKDKNQKKVEKEKQGEEGEESELQEYFDFEVIN